MADIFFEVEGTGNISWESQGHSEVGVIQGVLFAIGLPTLLLITMAAVLVCIKYANQSQDFTGYQHYKQLTCAVGSITYK